MHATIFPGADFTTQWFGQGNYTMPTISKLVLHDTESTSWPGYDGGLKAPTLTINPSTKQVRQHFPLNGSARALRDPVSTPVRENRDNVAQIEIIRFASKMTFLDDWPLNKIGEIAAFLHLEWELPLDALADWTPNRDDSQRLTSDQYDAFEGILGHMHVPGNDHLDPGPINIAYILDYAHYLIDNTTGKDDELTPQQSARLNWIYGMMIDGDGSPSISTQIATLRQEVDQSQQLLKAIAGKLGVEVPK